jgi:gamma-glutamylcyclotransferase (GGCT)/AIG2-like uncharacterized protein YtfP
MGLWLAGCAVWAGPAAIGGVLYRVSYYPGLVAGEGRVQGDVYALPGAERSELLARLDAFEGCTGGKDDEYRRTVNVVTMADGRTLEAWVYWYEGETAGLGPVAGGDWLAA